METTTVDGELLPEKKRTSRAPTAIRAIGHDILCTIFSLLDLFDLVRCSTVCKSWNEVIRKSKLFQVLYCKRKGASADFNASSSLEKSLKMCLEELAMEQHRLSFQEGRIRINQWKAHSVGVSQCRMKMGLVLTGVGDKVVRLWSLENYKCFEEYTVPDMVPLVDFDFDESKIVGLIRTRICIWRRNGKRSIFPSREGTFSDGLCIRYIDPEAVVGCEDGTARVFDMYSKKCSRIIRMHAGPVTCLSVSDDQLIVSGSSLGSITLSSLAADQRVAMLRSTSSTGITTLCFNPRSNLVFAGSTAGYASCWDLRKMGNLWETRVSPNVLYSMQHLQNDTSTLVVGGIDGVLRVLDQNTGEVLSCCVMESKILPHSSRDAQGFIQRRKGKRLSEETRIGDIPKSARPPITCLAVGMKKVVTTHNGKFIRLWKFS